MPSIKVRPLRDDLPFGARISGVDLPSLKDQRVQQKIKEIFWDRGVLVFEGMERSSELQVALSVVFGPLQEHALRGMPKVDKDKLLGVVEFNYEVNLTEADGKPLAGWVPWHYDACYTKELNRGGVLRALDIPPEGGLTGFADGIQLYQAISPELRAKCEGLKIIYHPSLMYIYQRFGMPKNYRWVRLSDSVKTVMEQNDSAPRSIHPAIWTRNTGERVLHVSPWQAAGIFEHEDEAGNALLEALCQEIYAKMTPYWHKWEPMDMVVWDNWRFIHSVNGHDPNYSRRMHRTTIKGDYGLGCFERDVSLPTPIAGADI